MVLTFVLIWIKGGRLINGGVPFCLSLGELIFSGTLNSFWLIGFRCRLLFKQVLVNTLFLYWFKGSLWLAILPLFDEPWAVCLLLFLLFLMEVWQVHIVLVKHFKQLLFVEFKYVPESFFLSFSLFDLRLLAPSLFSHCWFCYFCLPLLSLFLIFVRGQRYLAEHFSLKVLLALPLSVAASPQVLNPLLLYICGIIIVQFDLVPACWTLDVLL